MDKDSNTICISQKNTWIGGLITSLVFAIIGSYVGAYLMSEVGLVHEKIDVFKLGTIFIPILFVVFVIVISGFVLICSWQCKKK